MKVYIVIQMQVDSDSTAGPSRNVSLSNVVRRVEAESKESAIGKFVIAAQDIKAVKKLHIECYDLTELKSVY
mgnify:CR=1 FL=1